LSWSAPWRIGDQPQELAMTDAETLARIEALETRIAYQDRTIEELNASVTGQWKQIDGLTRQLEQMAERLQRFESTSSSAEEPPPPHY
jgi:SlyX protein